MQRRTAKSTKQFYGIIIVFILICFLICSFSFAYYKRLYTAIREESQHYLLEVSRRIGSNLERILADNFAVLYTMGAPLELKQSHTMDEVQTLLQRQKIYSNYENFWLVDENGTAYGINERDGTSFVVDDAMRADLLNQKPAMTNTQLINNQDYILFAVPLANITVDGERILALAASYNPTRLDQVLSMISFNDQAYSQIITKTGTEIARSHVPYAIKSGYNLFTTLESAELDVGYNLDRMRGEIQEGLENQISFTLNGMHWYMVYTPVRSHDWCLLTLVPFQVVNQKSDLLLKSTLQILGVIAATFGGLIAALYYAFSMSRKHLERIAYLDEVTGGNTIQRFYELSRAALNAANQRKYALIYTNIENFKVLNSQLGRKNCDAILYHFNTCVSNMLTEEECMGRLAADNFCVLIRYVDEEQMLHRLEGWGVEAEAYLHEQQVPWNIPSTEFGIYAITDASQSIVEMIDLAKMALKESHRPLASKMRCAFYDDHIRSQIVREKQITDLMESALANQEFQVYLQPKYHLPDETVGGAEALVRWASATEGMIFPDEFIPLFEKNGFVVQLDLWVFGEVCRLQQLWISQGKKPFKISVNCSRVHFQNPKFLAPYLRVFSQYTIDPSLIEMELTESVVFENTERLTQIIQEIHEAGFGCSMDDFGSGYSSLNLIQSIPVDTLKIDKIFFQRNGGEMAQTEAIVRSIVQMSRSLSLVTVAEGVEHPDQVEMLKRVGCDYIQGYVFAKPMPVDAFEAVAFGEPDDPNDS